MTIFLIRTLRRLAFGLAAPLLVASLLASCNRSAEPTSALSTSPKAVDEPKAGASAAEFVYVCPMHPHVRQHGPGKCPLCGMTLVKQKATADDAITAVGTTGASASAKAAAVESQKSSEGNRVLYYYDPMRPDVHFDKPGPSPFMDMALVPKLAGAARGTGVSINAEVIQSLGIRTAMPERRDVRTQVRVPARVVADARGQARLQSRVNGWVERLNVRAVGQSVSAGSVIAEIYSPELVQAQEELLLGADTAGPATERLRRFGISDPDIQAVRRSGKASRRLPLRAPVSGVVTELGVREGSSVTPDSVIADISARSAVWIEAQLFPAQRISLGNALSARFTLPGLGGREWRSDSGSIVPVADPVTQTLAVRFPLDNADDLPLGTILDGEISGSTHLAVLLVPAAAVIRTAQGDRVLVERPAGRFIPVPVRAGLRFGDELEILDGLALTDRIVISGQFLLDAEANLQSGLDQMGTADSSTDVGPTP